MGVLDQVKTCIFPVLRQIEIELAAAFPHLTIRTATYPIGTATAFQGHVLYVSCHFSGDPADQPDEVALLITIRHLTTQPDIDVEVTWESGDIEAQLFPVPTPVDEPTLTYIVQCLPHLASVLRQAIARGHPLIGQP